MGNYKSVLNVVEIPLDDLVIDIAQVRTDHVSKGISDLADSIMVNGLLEPIIVCPSSKRAGKYEILAGQRRFLAHRELAQRDEIFTTIKSIIRERPADEFEAKTLSLTENWLREDLSSKDERSACLILWRRYNSVKLILETTGLPEGKVRKYLKYEELAAPLKEKVDSGEVTLDAAVRANQASKISSMDDSVLIATAKELSGMSGVQQKNVIDIQKKNPEISLVDSIEKARTTDKITQVVIAMGPTAYSALTEYAKSERSKQGDAACSLIEEGLIDKGFLSEDN